MEILDKKVKIRSIYGICFAVLTVIVGLVFIIEVADLYYSAIAVDPSAPPYTVENISSHLVVPVVFLCIWIAAAIAGFVLSLIFKTESKKHNYVDNERTLTLLKAKVRENGAKDGHREALDSMRGFETFRLISRGILLAVLLICAVYILFYVYNPQNFHADGFKKDILKLVRTVLIWLVLGFVFTIFTSIVEGIAVKRELDDAKVALITGDKNSEIAEIKPKLLIALLMIVFSFSCLTLMMLVIFTISPYAFSALTGNSESGTYMPPVFMLLGLAAAVGVYVLIGRFAKKAKAPDKKTRLFCTIAAGAISLITVLLYIIAPPLVTMLMTKMPESLVYFAAPILIVIIAGFAIYHVIEGFVPEKANRIMLILTRASIAIVAVSFIIAGIVNGGANDVLLKAINICTECIGLG